MLASANQINYLKRASTWYVDCTFKAADYNLCKQAFGIHAFLQCGDNIKLVPLITVLMIRKTKKDYHAVFSELAGHLGVDYKLEYCVIV